jgi:hypothetical protein
MTTVISGSTGVAFPAANTPSVTNYQGGVLTSGTAQATTSGTSITFTGIPSWVKRITVMFNGVSTSGSSNIILQIGSGSVTTTGYSSCAGAYSLSSATNIATSTIGFITEASGNASAIRYGTSVLTNVTGNTWAMSSNTSTTVGSLVLQGAGGIALSGALDRVVITTVNGTDTFDAGSVNILYE